ncbi:MAG: hypothetical protein A2Z34_02665 [Planctomycetes bacterium RBG_16_59_8]|nr:MAG: hypothetical protein A2Z34_02665 [Planctomycetes bacterium RBG_16_59_8]
MPRFDYQAPTDLKEAIALLSGGATALAGGTDLMVKMKRGLARPHQVVSLQRIEGLKEIVVSANGVARIGALTTMAEIARHPLLSRNSLLALTEGANSVGGALIRNRATVGGNIVNARPCADTVAPLLALGANLIIDGPGGRRTRPIEGFITGPGKTSLLAGEILVAVEIPPPEGSGSCYIKITRRAVMEITIAGCAVSAALERDGRTIRQVRMALTSVASTPLVVEGLEKRFAGRVADDAALQEAAAMARQSAHPIDDHRAPAEYRSEVIEVIARRALRLALERAGGGKRK